MSTVNIFLQALNINIGVRGGKFWGCEGFLSEFPQTCPKIFCATFTYKIYFTKIMKTFLLAWPHEKGLQVFFFGFGDKKLNVGHHFCWDFRIFDRSKLLGVSLHPRLLHHCIPLAHAVTLWTVIFVCYATIRLIICFVCYNWTMLTPLEPAEFRFRRYNLPILAKSLQLHNSPVGCVRELSKPSKDSTSLVVFKGKKV